MSGHPHRLDDRVEKNVETLSNFSSFGMGGASHPNQLDAVKLFEPERVARQRNDIGG